MKSDKNYIYNSQDIVGKFEKSFIKDDIKDSNYLYPDGHRITHQMKWFKLIGARDHRYGNAAQSN